MRKKLLIHPSSFILAPSSFRYDAGAGWQGGRLQPDIKTGSTPVGVSD
jgi:hypothetical protein